MAAAGALARGAWSQAAPAAARAPSRLAGQPGHGGRAADPPGASCAARAGAPRRPAGRCAAAATALAHAAALAAASPPLRRTPPRRARRGSLASGRRAAAAEWLREARGGIQRPLEASRARGALVGAPLEFAVPGAGVVLQLAGGPASAGPGRERAVVFVHGSWHAAWCWDVHFLDYFRARGFDAYALSLRGHGGSGQGGAEDGTVEMHAGDVAAFVEHVHRESGRPVVLVGHSFGGLFVQSAASRLVAAGSAALAGAVLLSSVPPSGNAELGKRYFQRDFVLGARLTWAMVTRAFERDLELSRLMFFGQGMPLEQVGRYTDRMGEGCPPGARLLDLRRLSGSLPVEAVPPGKLPVMVAGGDADVIVDREALEETARAHGVEAVILEGVAHDAMLDLKWEDTANAIADWIERKT